MSRQSCASTFHALPRMLAIWAAQLPGDATPEFKLRGPRCDMLDGLCHWVCERLHERAWRANTSALLQSNERAPPQRPSSMACAQQQLALASLGPATRWEARRAENLPRAQSCNEAPKEAWAANLYE